MRGSIANAHSFASFLLGPKGKLDERTRRGLESILRSTGRALEQARAVFDSLRLEVGQLALEGEVQPVAPLLEQAVELCAATVERSRLQVHIPLDLPWAKVDSEGLVLATRAFLHHGASRGLSTGAVTLEALQLPEKIYVGVSDCGPSLSAVEHAQAYDRDHRVVREHGLREGFYLSVAKDYLEAMGGEVGSCEGPAGRTFFFTLPSVDARPPVS